MIITEEFENGFIKFLIENFKESNDVVKLNIIDLKFEDVNVMIDVIDSLTERYNELVIFSDVCIDDLVAFCNFKKLEHSNFCYLLD